VNAFVDAVRALAEVAEPPPDGGGGGPTTGAADRGRAVG
jgi:hypothetical protein